MLALSEHAVLVSRSKPLLRFFSLECSCLLSPKCLFLQPSVLQGWVYRPLSFCSSSSCVSLLKVICTENLFRRLVHVLLFRPGCVECFLFSQNCSCMCKKSTNNRGPGVENIISRKYWEEEWLKVKMKSVQTSDPERGARGKVAVFWGPDRAEQGKLRFCLHFFFFIRVQQYHEYYRYIQIVNKYFWSICSFLIF